KCAYCLGFRCGTVDVDCGHATCLGEGSSPNRWIGRQVPQVLGWILDSFSGNRSVVLPFGS
ncbi:unnamed protein product, partial [Prunus brigantina]